MCGLSRAGAGGAGRGGGSERDGKFVLRSPAGGGGCGKGRGGARRGAGTGRGGGAARGRPHSASKLLTPWLPDPRPFPAFLRPGAPLLARGCDTANLSLHTGP